MLGSEALRPMRHDRKRPGGHPNTSWVTEAKGLAIPPALSTLRCGGRADRWRARLAVLHVQWANVRWILDQGRWPPSTSRRNPPPLSARAGNTAGRRGPWTLRRALRAELRRIEGRIREAVAELEGLGDLPSR